MLEPGIKILFKLTGEQGAALVTKYQTLREDAELELAFKTYTKIPLQLLGYIRPGHYAW